MDGDWILNLLVFEKHQSKKSAPVKKENNKKKKRNEAMTFKVIQYLQKWIQMFCESCCHHIFFSVEICVSRAHPVVEKCHIIQSIATESLPGAGRRSEGGNNNI